MSWYGGYALGFIVEAVVGSKGLSKLDDIARASSRIESALDAAGRFRAGTIGRATGYVKSSAVRIGTELRERAPELDTQALRRSLDDLPTTVQQRIATRLSDDIDPDTRQLVADGGLDERLARYLEASNGDDAARLLNKLADADSNDLETFFDQSPSTRRALTRADRRTNGFDAARFIRNTDPEDRAVLDRFEEPTQTRLYLRYGDGDLDKSNLRRINELIESGDVDQADVQRLLGILETKDRNPLVDPDISTDEILDIGEKNSDLSEAQIVVKDANGQVRWTESGSETGGLQKIYTQHGDQFRDYDQVDSELDINRLIYRALDESDSQNVITEPNPGGGTRYYFQVTEDKPIRVVTGDNGFIFNAFPDSGSADKFD